mmetsp:Transcript_540/g.2130  ORF Transcript_540/g.2130 Transcript_540/m.2130 type:complete len:233 (+) Transcript_540:2399-3097(+)
MRGAAGRPRGPGSTRVPTKTRAVAAPPGPPLRRGPLSVRRRWAARACGRELWRRPCLRTGPARGPPRFHARECQQETCDSVSTPARRWRRTCQRPRRRCERCSGPEPLALVERPARGPLWRRRSERGFSPGPQPQHSRSLRHRDRLASRARSTERSTERSRSSRAVQNAGGPLQATKAHRHEPTGLGGATPSEPAAASRRWSVGRRWALSTWAHCPRPPSLGSWRLGTHAKT